MSVYIGGPLRNKEFRDLEAYMLIAKAIRKMGFDPYIPHMDTARVDTKVGETELYYKNMNALRDASFAVFEISHPSHGVGMELQYALTHKIPFLCLVKKGYPVSKMIQGKIEKNQLIRYSELHEIETRLENKVTKAQFLEIGKERSGHESGKLFSIEGIDFTGKSTICKKMEEAFRKEKRNAIVVTDPPSIEPWSSLKEFFERGQAMSNVSEAFVLLSARLDNYERTIKPALDKGSIVIADRFTDSWIAYQSCRLSSHFNRIDDAVEFLLGMNESLCDASFLRMPDLTILINDEPEKIIRRAKSRGRLSKYENLATQKSVQSLYLKLAKRFNSRFKVIRAENRELDDVFLEAFSLCKSILG